MACSYSTSGSSHSGIIGISGSSHSGISDNSSIGNSVYINIIQFIDDMIGYDLSQYYAYYSYHYE